MAARDRSAVIEGARPIIEAIRAERRRVREVFLPREPRAAAALELAELARERSIPTASRESTEGLGVWARAEPYPEESFEELLMAEPPHFLVALDRVTDVGNLGSIARSAEGAGATGLVLEQRHAPPIGPGALRASAGALEHLRVGRCPSLRRALELAAGEGLVVLAAEQGAGPIEALDPSLLTGDLLWVFGSEDRGLRPAIRARASAQVGIPLAGRVTALGVAAAAAYLLHRTAELRRHWRLAAE